VSTLGSPEEGRYPRRSLNGHTPVGAARRERHGTAARFDVTVASSDSRLDFAPKDAAAEDARVRVIAVDRLAIGSSDPQPRRNVLD
jgi:hypothetical protein